MRSERLYLADIVEAAEAVLRFVSGLSREAFLTDDKAQSATLYKLIIIGEAAGNISPELRDRHPEVPWRAVRGFRDVAVHAYHTVDWSIVWSTVIEELPPLLAHIRAILKSDYGAA